MFYSQFILAKKGPLGTIWIAAHLERKLRKNQVADTDIGVSVDSILFPDVPIALRLSSHLLLGVVRIYSRKVNYLFDDCSEALLKVKQAFRSTAVDLPPEESKAPYHSITLPETFDLDDFELPDNDIFQGNFVDHHISSREQITLQDNMEGVVYSTSQFGLDERFGDGDTSGLDLDEELLMGKVDATGYSGVSADPQSSFNSMTHMKLEGSDEGLHENAESQMEDVEDVGLMDYAQAPSTPGLVEVPNLSNVQETSCCDDHIESEENHLTELAVKDLENASTGLILQQGNEHAVDWSGPNDSNSDAARCNGYYSNDLEMEKGFPPLTADNNKHTSSEGFVAAAEHPFEGEVEVDHDEPVTVDKIIAASDELNLSEKSENVDIIVDRVDIPAVDVPHKGNEMNGTISEVGADYASIANSAQPVLEDGVEKSNDSLNDGNSEKPSSSRDGVSTELQVTSGLEKPEIPLGQVKIIRPCNADMGKPDPTGNSMDFEPHDIAEVELETSEMVDVSRSTVVQGEICNSVGESELVLKENHIVEPASPEGICALSAKSDDLGHNMMQGDTAGIECAAPEKMLSLPEGFVDQPRNLLMESTPADMARVDESDAGSRIVSGKKRSYTESTLTEQSLNSVESSRAVRIKKTVEAIPDDDDLLSSILVGRRSSALKVKPTPPPGEITSTKRQRTAPRSSTSKRKVLMDDTMVLHGDTIRQQLMNTEDIRRLRKKAPCTRPEIAMIQRQFLEDQIFRESIFSGVSIYLASLHNRTYDLSGIEITKDDLNDIVLATEPISTSKIYETDIVAENAVDASGPIATVLDDRDGPSELETVRKNGKIQSGQMCELDDVKHDGLCEPSEDLAVTSDTSRLQTELLQDLAGNEVGGSSSVAEAEHPSIPLEIGDRVSSDIVDIPSDAVRAALLETRSEMDAPGQMDEPLISCDETTELQCVEVDGSMMDGIIGKVNDDNDGTVHVGDSIATGETGHSARDGIFQEAGQAAAAVEIDREAIDQLDFIDHGPFVGTESADLDSRRGDNHGQIYDGISGEKHIISSSSPGENISLPPPFLYEGEDFMLPKCNLGDMVDADISGVNMHDQDDPNYSAAANDTEFLNFDDDDEVAEMTDDHVPDAEEIRFTENTGWSSRTRAVAKYLQTLFVKEAECGRKAIPVDSLLVGKTRKEASRMFFEALVLKTRDYIHVEQQCPFDNIIVKPKAKLVKSDF